MRSETDLAAIHSFAFDHDCAPDGIVQTHALQVEVFHIVMAVRFGLGQDGIFSVITIVTVVTVSRQLYFRYKAIYCDNLRIFSVERHA